MGAIAYCRPSDNIAATATITLPSGTADSAYPSANLVDLDPAKPAKLTTTTGRWVFNFGSAKELLAAVLAHTNIDAGLEVRLQGNATDAWGAPSLNQTFTMPAAAQHDFRASAFVNLSAVSPRTYQYWSVVVVGTNAAAIAIGEIVLSSALRQFTKNIGMGVAETEEQPVSELRTAGGSSLIYRYGTRKRRLSGELLRDDSAADWADMLALVRDARGRGKSFVFMPDLAVNDAWVVRFAGASVDAVVTRPFSTHRRWTWTVEEVVSGLVL